MEKGRNCSLEYILQKDWTKKSKKLEEEVIYIVGGLYGNRYAENDKIRMYSFDKIKMYK